jgi:hypothetical protein
VNKIKTTTLQGNQFEDKQSGQPLVVAVCSRYLFGAKSGKNLNIPCVRQAFSRVNIGKPGKALQRMRVSEYFKLGKPQPFLDFVDIRLDTDIEVFVDPTALKSLKSIWGHECSSLVQNYFDVVLSRIKDGHHLEAQKLVSCLNERNEFHLGYSAGRSRGHAFGSKSAESVWSALSKSQASVSGLLKDLEDTCLLIDGIGRDMISDAVCNILRGPLIKYTQDVAQYYGIPLTPDIASGPIWNPEAEVWESALVPLPVTSQGKVILVPKVLVRHRLSYQYHEYYADYLLPEMQQEEIQAKSSLVELLKDGTPRVTKKALRAKYGSNKLAVVQQTLKRPHVLSQYKEDKEKQPPPPLEHEQLAEIEGSNLPDWDKLLNDLRALPTGQNHASEYEELIERILTAVFYPSLCKPQKQHKIHDGRKRIDITYTNEARSGFFHWLSLHYPSALIFVECKNYGKEIGNPELDQLSGRFSPSRGQVGILICRRC